MKQILLIALLGASLSASAQTTGNNPADASNAPQLLSLSYDDALQMLQRGNQSLKIADKGIETARAERDKLNALWYPSLQGAGTYVRKDRSEATPLPIHRPG
mgnify:CR=1 FL=1